MAKSYYAIFGISLNPTEVEVPGSWSRPRPSVRHVAVTVEWGLMSAHDVQARVLFPERFPSPLRFRRVLQKTML